MTDDLDWAAGAADEPVKALATVVEPSPLSPIPAGTGAAITRQESLREKEDDMLQSSLEVVGGAIDFAELEPDEDGKIPMPEGWVEKYGEKGAGRRKRMAMAGMMPAKEAPVGIKLAAQMVTGIVKARSAEKHAVTFNMGIMVFQGQREKYEEIDE